MDLEPVIKALVTAICKVAGVPEWVSGGGWEFGKSAAKYLQKKADPVSRSLRDVGRDIDAWGRASGFSPEEVSAGLSQAMDAVGFVKSSKERWLQLDADGDRIAADVAFRSKHLRSLGGPENEVCLRALRATYSAVLLNEEVLKWLDPSVAQKTLGQVSRLFQDLSRRESETAGRYAGAARRARESSEHELSTRMNSSPGRYAKNVVIPQYGHLKSGLTTNWAQDVAERLQLIRDELTGGPTSEYLGKRLVGPLGRVAAVDTLQSYESIRRDLGACDIVGVSRGLPRPFQASDKEGARAIVDLRKAVSWLSEQVNAPRYMRMILICGGWGTGKSRLAFELSRGFNTAEHTENFTVFPVFTAGESCERQILDQIGRSWGEHADSVFDVLRIIDNSTRGSLLICIEDFDRTVSDYPHFMAQLADLVRRWSLYPQIRWLVTADSHHLDLLMDSSSRFWDEYGLGPEAGKEVCSIGTWLDLDQVNPAATVGFKLINDAAGDHYASDLLRLESEIRDFTFLGRRMCDPLPAWLQIENPAEDGLLFDTRASDVIEAYWTERSGAIRREDPEFTLTIERSLLSCVTEMLSARDRAVIGFEDLAHTVRFLSPALVQVDDAGIRRFIGHLESAGLVRFVRGDRGVGVQITAEMFWGGRIAAQLIEGGFSGASLEAWQARSDLRDWLAEAVMHSLLSSSMHGLAAPELWRTCLSDGENLLAVWSAGTSAPTKVQREIAACVRDWAPDFANRHEFYMFLRFMALASDRAVNGAQRMQALKDHYARVGSDGVGGVLQFAFRRSLQMTPPQSRQFDSFLMSLVGVEASGLAEIFCDSVVEHAVDGFRQEGEWLVPFLRFFKRQDVVFPTRADGQDPTRCAYYWEFLLRAVLKKASAEPDLSWVRVLDTWGWFGAEANGGQLPNHVARRFRAEVNVLLGAYHRSRRVADDDLLDLLWNLVGAKAMSTSAYDQRERAAFVIKHTEALEGRRTSTVDIKFIPVLKALLADDTISRRHGRWIRELIEASR